LALAIVTFALFHIGARALRLIDLVVVSTVIVFSPLVLRAVFVDYSDFVIVTAGVAAIVVALYAPVTWRFSTLLGVLLATMCIANVFAVSLSFFILLARMLRLRENRERLRDFTFIAASGAMVVLLGWAFFRVRYDIANVYGPTVDFVRESSKIHDLLKSPRRQWLRYRLWIYLPPIVLATAALLWRFKKAAFGRVEALAFAVCGIQYLFQVWYQFGRDGTTLEIHYYFTYAIPPLLVSTAIVLYQLLTRCSPRAVAGIGVAVVLLWVNDGSPWRFGSGLQALIALVVGGAVASISFDKVKVLPAALLVATFLAFQLAYPKNEPLLSGEQRVNPGYDTVWTRADSSGRDVFHESVWSMSEMDRLGNAVEQRSGFVLAGGPSYQLGATYSVEVAKPRHWINQPIADPGFDITSNSLQILRDLRLPYVVVICAPGELPAVLADLAAVGIESQKVLLDSTSTVGSIAAQVHVFEVTDAAAHG
ncbi:MAG TPA: hypothetical protein VGC84_05670, partial [Ilumatobacteraceae bacterium]